MKYTDTQDQEDCGNAVCARAAELNWLKPGQAEACVDGQHHCPYCPWRDPLEKPAGGDLLTLASGKRIKVEFVNLTHCTAPELEYSFVDWTKWAGGRKSYRRKLSDWPALVAGATVTQIGKRPSKWATDGRGAKREAEYQAFALANRKLNLSLKPVPIGWLMRTAERLGDVPENITAGVPPETRLFSAGDACPECGNAMILDNGEEMSRAHPGQAPCVFCTDCGMEYPVD